MCAVPIFMKLKWIQSHPSNSMHQTEHQSNNQSLDLLSPNHNMLFNQSLPKIHKYNKNKNAHESTQANTSEGPHFFAAEVIFNALGPEKSRDRTLEGATKREKENTFELVKTRRWGGGFWQGFRDGVPCGSEAAGSEAAHWNLVIILIICFIIILFMDGYTYLFNWWNHILKTGAQNISTWSLVNHLHLIYVFIFILFFKKTTSCLSSCFKVIYFYLILFLKFLYSTNDLFLFPLPPFFLFKKIFHYSIHVI